MPKRHNSGDAGPKQPTKKQKRGRKNLNSEKIDYGVVACLTFHGTPYLTSSDLQKLRCVNRKFAEEVREQADHIGANRLMRQPHGEVTKEAARGEVKSIYFDGKKHGTTVRTVGRYRCKIPYKNGVIDGTAILYRHDQLLARRSVKYGVSHGLSWAGYGNETAYLLGDKVSRTTFDVMQRLISEKYEGDKEKEKEFFRTNGKRFRETTLIPRI
jgi:hypothetical protein